MKTFIKVILAAIAVSSLAGCNTPGGIPGAILNKAHESMMVPPSDMKTLVALTSKEDALVAKLSASLPPDANFSTKTDQVVFTIQSRGFADYKFAPVKRYKIIQLDLNPLTLGEHDPSVADFAKQLAAYASHRGEGTEVGVIGAGPDADFVIASMKNNGVNVVKLAPTKGSTVVTIQIFSSAVNDRKSQQ